MWRSALLALFVRARLDKYAFAAYNDVVVIGLALVWLVLAVVTEAWFRESAGRRALGRMAVRTDGAVVVLIAVGYAAYLVLG